MSWAMEPIAARGRAGAPRLFLTLLTLAKDERSLSHGRAERPLCQDSRMAENGQVTDVHCGALEVAGGLLNVSYTAALTPTIPRRFKAYHLRKSKAPEKNRHVNAQSAYHKGSAP